MSRSTALSVLRPAQVKDGDDAPFGQVTQPLALDAFSEHPEIGLTPQRALAIFRLAEDGYLRDQCNLFDGVIERNATARQLFEGRRAAVAGKEWSITADGTEGDAELAAQVLDEAHRDLASDMGDTFDQQLTHVSHGFGASEIDWGVKVYGDRIWRVPIGYVSAPHRRFRVVPRTDELRLLTDDQPIDGEALAPGKWWITSAAGSRVARAGLMRTATWLTIWSSYALRDWLIKSERFGIPQAIANFDPNIEDAGKAVALDLVKGIGKGIGAAVPNGIKLEIIEPKSTADGAGVHAALIAYVNRELAKLVVGGTLSTDSQQSGQGSYAQAEVHADVRFELVQGDARRLQRTWRQQVALPFMRFNALVGRPPLLGIHIARDQTPQAFVSVADTLRNKLGVPVSISQLRQVTGVVAPAKDDDSATGAPPLTSRLPGGAP